MLLYVSTKTCSEYLRVKEKQFEASAYKTALKILGLTLAMSEGSHVPVGFHQSLVSE